MFKWPLVQRSIKPSYTKYSVWSELESVLVDSKLWTVFLLPDTTGTPGAVQQPEGIAARCPSKGSAAGGRGVCEAFGRDTSCHNQVLMNTSTSLSTSRVEFERLRSLQLSLTIQGLQVTGCFRSGTGYLKG
jgi:hypothetical protein